MPPAPAGSTDPAALARYLHLLASLSQGVLFLNSEGYIVDGNPAAERILGMTLAEMRSLEPFDPRWQSFKEDGTPFTEDDYPVSVALRTRQAVRDAVMCLPNAAGGHKWLQVNAIPLVDPGRDIPDLIVAIFEDITDAKRTTEALRRSEERFRLVAECSNDVLWEWDLETNRLEYFGELQQDLAEYGTEAPFDVWLETTHPDERDGLVAAMNALAQSGTVLVREHRLRMATGWRDVITRAVVVRAPGGQAIRIVGATTDISAERRAQRDREDTLNLFRAVIEGTRDPIYVKDLEGRFQLLNEAGAARLGVPPNEALGKRNQDFLPEHLSARFQEYEEQVMRSRSSITYEAEGWGATAGRTYFTTKLPLHGPSGELAGTITIARDVTELKTLEARLRHAQKMEAIGRLAGGVAHDFNNLLMVIIGCCSEVQEQVVTSAPAVKDNIGEALKAADRAAQLTRQLLAFSRRQMLEPRVTDLNAIVSNAERMFRRIIGEDIRLRTTLAGDLGAVNVDPGQIEQVLLNLVINSRDAMPRGGELSIETANVDIAGGATRGEPDLVAGSYVRLRVTDTGVGMSAETLANIFEPFYTTKTNGTGLGLATVYGIVKQSGGEIWAESRPGGGTSFSVLLPRHHTHDADGSQPAPRVERGRELVLLAEDERSLRELLSRYLTRQGYRVALAANGVEALRVVERLGEPPAMLITDVIMPEMDGHTLAVKLRERLPDIPVLYMSGFADHAVLDAAMMSPADKFLQKPFTPSALAHTVREMLDRV